MAKPIENDYGIINAWLNGKEATVENIQLKINEPAELKVEIILKKDCDVYLKISNPMITEAYKIESGPSDYDKYFSKEKVEANEILTYSWIIKPTGDWTDGNAPINIRIIFTKKEIQMPIEFTIANPYILEEHYSGPAAAPSSTDQPPSSEGSPGFGALAALAGTALVIMWRRRRI
jgi:sarcinarray family protein